jgi:hypothetical protein
MFVDMLDKKHPPPTARISTVQARFVMAICLMIAQGPQPNCQAQAILGVQRALEAHPFRHAGLAMAFSRQLMGLPWAIDVVSAIWQPRKYAPSFRNTFASSTWSFGC